MKDRIKELTKKHPVIEKYLRMLISGPRINQFFPIKRIKGKNNSLIIAKSALLQNCKFDIEGHNNTLEIQETCFLKGVSFYIRGNNNKVFLGQGVRFNQGGSVWIEDENCEAVIGENTSIENAHLAVTESHSKIHIGKDCMLAYDIDLRTGDSHSILDTNTNMRINPAQSISIGNHVWIASHVSILKGVEIADNSVIATRAVVTKSFSEKNILIGGMPAKKLKENVDWKRERI
ncbi:MAG: acyltransferase [Bacteroidetes bacterium]|nr:acyltransferase [Bacteroidota bacterium]